MQTEYIWSGKIYVKVKYMISYKICSGKMYAQVKYMIGDGIYIQIRHIIDWDKIICNEKNNGQLRLLINFTF